MPKVSSVLTYNCIFSRRARPSDASGPRYGKILIKTYESLKHAGAEVNERCSRILLVWTRISEQLSFMKSIEYTLSLEYRAAQEATLEILAGKLKTACTKLDALLKKSDVRASQTGFTEVSQWKYICTKTSLDECIVDLQAWQAIFDPSWYLILRITGQQSQIVDQQLACRTTLAVVQNAANVRNAIGAQPTANKRIFLAADVLEYSVAEAISYSPAKFIPRPKSTKWVVIDPVPYNGTDRDIQTRDVRDLATRLSNVDPKVFNILKCRGVIRSLDTSGNPPGFNVVFDTPTDTTQRPQSLRYHLTQQTSHSLTHRFDFARQIANSVSFVHTLGFVHKNVRPENLIEFDSSASRLGSLYLLGFEQVRSADGKTYRQGDSTWTKDLYRHPSRQGIVPSEDYRMQHDIYSLGVCLLEIGLWESFLLYDDEGKSAVNAKVLDLAIKDDVMRSPAAVKDHLVQLAEMSLPSCMGDAYRSIVINCLTCLDDDNVDFGDRSEFEDEDGVLVGVRYIQKVGEPTTL